MADTNKAIKDIITGWVGKDVPFTAWTVYEELKKLIDVPYPSVKKDIHREVQSFVKSKLYQVSRVTTPTGPALLYHAPGYDPKKFFDKKTDSDIVI